MADLAIKGHTTRGKEVIQLLEMLGGVNKYQIDAIRQTYIYFIDIDNIIRLLKIDQLLPEKDIVYSLEEFEEKYPYKVGDKVILDEIPCTITWMCWECNNVYYQVQGIGDVFTKKVTAEDLQPFKEETMEDKDMDEKDKAKAPDLKGEDYSGRRFGYKIPDGYEFDTMYNGNIILKPIKPQYPKTYDECCDILNIETNRTIDYCDDYLGYRGITQYDINLLTQLRNLRKLRICRDAYWKIAGEEMGLDKPWEYDMSKNEFSCAISYEYGSIQKCEVRYRNHFLVFPTKEMRDMFYANFKELIEECKELL